MYIVNLCMNFSIWYISSIHLLLWAFLYIFLKLALPAADVYMRVNQKLMAILKLHVKNNREVLTCDTTCAHGIMGNCVWHSLIHSSSRCMHASFCNCIVEEQCIIVCLMWMNQQKVYECVEWFTVGNTSVTDKSWSGCLSLCTKKTYCGWIQWSEKTDKSC